MPNHVHGILILSGNDEFLKGLDGSGGSDGSFVGTLHATSLQMNPIQNNPIQTQHDKNEQMSKISPKSNSVSTIVRSYKSAVTKHAHRLGFEFAWQSRFHDHIIQNEKSFQHISNYILNNPLNWKDDKFFDTLETKIK